MNTKYTKIKTSLPFSLIFLFLFLAACVLSQVGPNASAADEKTQEKEVKLQECMVAGKEKSCAQCHTLSKTEAFKVLSVQGPRSIKIFKISPSQIPGLWEVYYNLRGRRTVAYVDYSKKYFISGEITDSQKNENITKKRMIELSRVDLSLIPTEHALLLGSPTAQHKVIVFDDPDCSYCKKLHDSMKEVIEQNPDIAFYIKLFPLPMHRQAYTKSVTIACEKSLQLLEDNFADPNKKMPKKKCALTEVDDNIKLAEQLGITGTPTLVMPNGIVMPGYLDAQTLIKKVLDNAQ